MEGQREEEERAVGGRGTITAMGARGRGDCDDRPGGGGGGGGTGGLGTRGK